MDFRRVVRAAWVAWVFSATLPAAVSDTADTSTVKRNLHVSLVVLSLCASAGPAHAVDRSAIFSHKAGIWRIPAAGTLRRWIVIHNLKEAATTGTFHIEVIGRKRVRPAWDIQHLCSHMAITVDALRRSVTEPMESGAVYPESFDSAYAAWKQADAAGKAEICDRSVIECLPKPSSAARPGP